MFPFSCAGRESPLVIACGVGRGTRPEYRSREAEDDEDEEEEINQRGDNPRITNIRKLLATAGRAAGARRRTGPRPRVQPTGSAEQSGRHLHNKHVTNCYYYS